MNRDDSNRGQDFVEVDAEYMTQTRAAVLIIYNSRECWVPKSLIEPDDAAHIQTNVNTRHEAITLHIREWFAYKNSLC
jgi:hypothetical protein